MNKWLWLDMDGTFVNLYGVDNWLDDLRAHNVRPYAQAKPIYNMADLLEVLVELKLRGFRIGVISWLSKDRNAEYEREVARVKKEWLTKNCMDLVLDKIIITPYGMCKADTCRQYGYGILCDDEEQNRNAWDLGDTINATENLIKNLKKLLDK